MSGDPRPKRFGWMTAARYRTLSEARIAEAILLDGWAFEAAQGETEARMPDTYATIERLVALGLPFRATLAGRAFDPVEVVNFSRCLSLEGRDPFWIDRCVRTRRALVGLLETGAGRSGPAPHRFDLDLRRTFDVVALDRTKPLRFRLPLPIEDENLGELTIHRIATGPLDWRISGDRCRIEARGLLPPGPTFSLSVGFRFTATAGAIRSKGDDWPRFLHRSEGLIEVTLRVQELADRLAEGNPSPRDTVSRFWDFMLDDLLCGEVHYDQVAAAATALDWVLDSGWYDCQLGSALLSALCRARGIPARIVGGYLLYPIAASYHYWTEVWFEDEGWVHYDTLAWDLSAGGHDTAWRGRFDGAIEPRFKTECRPLQFTGFCGVAFPEVWHLLTRRGQAGTETGYHNVDTGALVYSDEVDVRDLGPIGGHGLPPASPGLDGHL